ncbi:oligosaccharide flippase family protein [Desulfoscipio gibsoniae]|uniref:Membrane protein involved in the export of O-antigen and teichoic acid n=1 Tax=Desulfoscipio gibsoniae DSM 7213 TaxID=767817 RepID=R4KL59_9FIRM|nr:oligosaccharide flippase family protein [Desulfoscipio gibsoniae]AGL03933.1 membrane protein involved in the export of O-antigen and teichoic acid [Desulfoscipio gibsoniae DSM 7213]
MSFKKKVLKGGAYLIARQGLGLFISFVGILLLTRSIGPGNYGLFISAQEIVLYLSHLVSLGNKVYLIRRETEPCEHEYNQAFTLMFITSMVGLLLGIAVIPLLQQWLKNPAFIPPLLILLLTLPLTALSTPAMAKLERDLNYRAVSIIELAGQLINYIIALTLAYYGKGVWAPVAGYMAWQVLICAGSCIMARLTPRPYWSRDIVADMLKYGISYSTSVWIWQLRPLVNPLIVGRYAGPEVVGCVALAIRFVDALSFVKNVVQRISIAVLAELQKDQLRLKEAIEKAMVFQILAFGPLLISFSFIAPLVFPGLFGDQWNKVLLIYPFIALSYLFNTVFNMHSSVLYVLRRNYEVTIFHTVYILLLTAGALLLLPRFGLLGYGIAEVLTLFSYVIIHYYVRRIFPVSYKNAIPWLTSFIFLLFSAMVDLPLNLLFGVPLLIVLAKPASRQKILDYVKFIKGSNK